MYTRSQIEENLAYARARATFEKSWQSRVYYWENELNKLPLPPVPVASEPAAVDLQAELTAKTQESLLHERGAEMNFIEWQKAEAERDALAAALAFYADGIKFNGWDWIAPDDGEQARQALAAVGKKGGE